jgi:hypothetical protein
LFLEVILFEAGHIAHPLVVGKGDDLLERLVIEDDPGGVKAGLAGQPLDFRGEGDDLR